MRPECTSWLDEVEEQIPSFRLQISADAEFGRPSVSLDGRQIGVPTGSISADPGEHELRVWAKGYEPVRAGFVLERGEQDREIRIHLTPLPPDHRNSLAQAALEPGTTTEAATQEAPRFTPPVLISGGVAVLGLTSFVWFGSAGRRHDRALDDCAPDCSDDRVNTVRTEYLIANVSLGVAAAALLTGGSFYFLQGPSDSSSGSATARKATVAHESRPTPRLTELGIEGYPGYVGARLGGDF